MSADTPILFYFWSADPLLVRFGFIFIYLFGTFIIKGTPFSPLFLFGRFRFSQVPWAFICYCRLFQVPSVRKLKGVPPEQKGYRLAIGRDYIRHT